MYLPSEEALKEAKLKSNKKQSKKVAYIARSLFIHQNKIRYYLAHLNYLLHSLGL